MSAPRTSPLAHRFATLHPEWVDVQGMALAASLPGETPERTQTLGVCDLSGLARVGVKGPHAAEWLAARDVSAPLRPNSWRPIEGGGLVARLARTEFLVEDGFGGGMALRLAPELRPGSPGVYPVPRQDCALALTGTKVNELLVQTCNVDFSALDSAARDVTLTQMVGVSVTVLRADIGATPCYRLWCDGTSGVYLWETLTGIAAELGGGPIGFKSLHA